MFYVSSKTQVIIAIGSGNDPIGINGNLENSVTFSIPIPLLFHNVTNFEQTINIYHGFTRES
jgi:hypothetical protein